MPRIADFQVNYIHICCNNRLIQIVGYAWAFATTPLLVVPNWYYMLANYENESGAWFLSVLIPSFPRLVLGTCTLIKNCALQISQLVLDSQTGYQSVI